MREVYLHFVLLSLFVPSSRVSYIACVLYKDYTSKTIAQYATKLQIALMCIANVNGEPLYKPVKRLNLILQPSKVFNFGRTSK